VIENKNPYLVDAEIGRFDFPTHSITDDNKNVIFNSAKNVFRTLGATERYRTEGFNELALWFASRMSYKDAADTLNRVRQETIEPTPIRTLANIVEIEGKKLENSIIEKAKDILNENGCKADGTPRDTDASYGKTLEEVAIPKGDVKEVMDKYNANQNDEELKIDKVMLEKAYEDAQRTVNVSVDDVGVKKQKENRKGSGTGDGLKYVRNTIAHIESSGKRYILNARSTVAIIPIIIAFLIHNGLIGKYVQFYVDGERTLHSAILNGFKWFKGLSILLDWYHLEEKCKMELSLALKNKDIRNGILDKILPQLWLGKVDKAIEILREIEACKLKSGKGTEGLIGYFERNREYIPCYALRKKLGLRNSSNKGEKSNDLIVSKRQKHNGMSWSKDGSVALASVVTMHNNREEKNWYSNKSIEFKLVA
jgi:hypothetical protein